jgi:hypothetical protein
MRAALAFLVVVLLAASAFARDAPAGDVKKMGETHSGSAAGVVKDASAGTKGQEKKIGT